MPGGGFSFLTSMFGLFQHAVLRSAFIAEADSGFHDGCQIVAAA